MGWFTRKMTLGERAKSTLNGGNWRRSRTFSPTTTAKTTGMMVAILAWLTGRAESVTRAGAERQRDDANSKR